MSQTHTATGRRRGRSVLVKAILVGACASIALIGPGAVNAQPAGPDEIQNGDGGGGGGIDGPGDLDSGGGGGGGIDGPGDLDSGGGGGGGGGGIDGPGDLDSGGGGGGGGGGIDGPGDLTSGGPGGGGGGGGGLPETGANSWVIALVALMALGFGLPLVQVSRRNEA